MADRTSIRVKTDPDAFLAKYTFACTVYNARISKGQCKELVLRNANYKDSPCKTCSHYKRPYKAKGVKQHLWQSGRGLRY